MPYKDPEVRRAFQTAYRASADPEKRREQMRQWQRAHADKQREYKHRYHAKRLATDLSGVREEQRRAWLKRRYGITIEEHLALIDAHDNRCAICAAQGTDSAPLHVDHDHLTLRVRGMLCGACNRAIGLFKDDPEVMERAAQYLKRAGTEA